MKLQEWAHVAEIIGGAAIIVSLIVLIQEIQQSTAVRDREIQLARLLNFGDDYISPIAVPDIYAKVKAVDGLEPLAQAYVDRYELTPSEAVTWSRVVSQTLYLWQSDYEFVGANEDLERELKFIPTYPDLVLAFETNEDGLLTPEFVAYVESVLAE